MSRRNENPLGIRKVDYQHERREVERVTSKHVPWSLIERGLWKGVSTDPESTRFASTMYCYGWEAGVRVGVDKTKERIAEALERGTLIKPDATSGKTQLQEVYHHLDRTGPMGDRQLAYYGQLRAEEKSHAEALELAIVHFDLRREEWYQRRMEPTAS